MLTTYQGHEYNYTIILSINYLLTHYLSIIKTPTFYTSFEYLTVHPPSYEFILFFFNPLEVVSGYRDQNFKFLIITFIGLIWNTTFSNIAV